MRWYQLMPVLGGFVYVTSGWDWGIFPEGLRAATWVLQQRGLCLWILASTVYLAVAGRYPARGTRGPREARRGRGKTLLGRFLVAGVGYFVATRVGYGSLLRAIQWEGPWFQKAWGWAQAVLMGISWGLGVVSLLLVFENHARDGRLGPGGSQDPDPTPRAPDLAHRVPTETQARTPAWTPPPGMGARPLPNARLFWTTLGLLGVGLALNQGLLLVVPEVPGIAKGGELVWTACVVGAGLRVARALSPPARTLARQVVAIAVAFFLLAAVVTSYIETPALLAIDRHKIAELLWGVGLGTGMTVATHRVWYHAATPAGKPGERPSEEKEPPRTIEEASEGQSGGPSENTSENTSGSARAQTKETASEEVERPEPAAHGGGRP